MDSRLDKLSQYFNEKERKRLEKLTQERGNGIPEMTLDEIKLTCLENNGYESPELNDKLYLHLRGFKKIENLDLFTGCKAIWLESNGFSKIENLSPLINLRCLYLAKNLISKIEGLDALTHLSILDLSNNRLTLIENLAQLPELQTVNVSYNALSTLESISHFKDCPALGNLDLTNNRLPAEEELFALLKSFETVNTLAINGNEVTKLPFFRKRVVSTMPQLGYLDRPIDEQERRLAEAFVRGGADEEAAERSRWRDEQTARRQREQAEFREWQAKHQKEREEARARGETVKSYMQEMTPEEVQQRQQEAEAAHQAEMDMLAMGVDKLGKKYWELDGANGGGNDGRIADTNAGRVNHGNPAMGLNNTRQANRDMLDEAARQLKLEREHRSALPPAPPAAGSEGRVEVMDEEDELRRLAEQDAAVIAAANAAVAAGEGSKAVEELLAAEESKSAAAEQQLCAAPPVPRPASSSAAEMAAQEEEYERQQRVQDSLSMYKAQLAARESGQQLAQQPLSSTWNQSVEAGNGSGMSGQRGPAPLYWSEGMDMQLAKLVKECCFDFDAIAVKMQEVATAGQFVSKLARDKYGESLVPEQLTSEACRMRWTDLDASMWGELPPDSSAADTLFKICINPAVLGAGHGAQPDFAQLANMASGMPSYLKAPTAFPSVRGGEDDSDDEELELD